LLPGLLATNGGTVRVFGLDPVADPVGVRLRLGYMTDDAPVWDLPLHRLIPRIADFYPSWDPALCDDLLRRFELPSHQKPSELSKGMGTRLRLVLAAGFRPRLLVLDEPATGLDLTGRRALLRTILDALDDPGRSVVVSSHQLDDLERVADELLVLHRGEVVRQGPTDEVVGAGRTLEEAMVAWGVAR
jgi:ABC-2 type transport system ATP-binding protein